MVADVQFGGLGGRFGGCIVTKSYTLTVADRTLALSSCMGNAPLPDGAVPDGAVTTSERILSTAEFDGVSQALNAVTVSSATECSGADGAPLTLAITNATGTHVYWDDTYACVKSGTYATNVPRVFDALFSLEQ